MKANVCTLVSLLFLLLSIAALGQETVLHNFDGTDGAMPMSGLIFDSAGNLYGTTYGGGNSGGLCGSSGCGTVFELTPGSNGQWTETLLHAFVGDDGVSPYGGLVLDGAGNLYGTTMQGGTYNNGVVFELSPQSNGTWHEMVLHHFGKGNDGGGPRASLIFDSVGNIYGTTSFGGEYKFGTVFELSPVMSGWKETILHSFGKGNDGRGLSGSLVLDAMGNLYGTTVGDSNKNFGSVFELVNSGGVWTEKVLHTFNDTSKIKIGDYPFGNLVFDGAGNLYGTTALGGPADDGTIFELVKEAGGLWTEKVIHAFYAHPPDGIRPNYGIVFDGAGNLYGTTYMGGKQGSSGTVFKFTPTTGGHWKETLLYTFKDIVNGRFPMCNLVLDSAGNLYGTTMWGGSFAYKDRRIFGVVFEVAQ